VVYENSALFDSRLKITLKSMTDLAHIEANLAAVRRLYTEQRDGLEALLAGSFRNPAEATDILLAQADEFGSAHAATLLRQRPEDFGDRRDGMLTGKTEVFPEIESMLERLGDTHERLDALTVEREALKPQSGKADKRVLHIQGHEFSVDAEGRAGPLENQREGPERSLTERLMHETGASQAEPTPQPHRDRTPGHDR
jgi:hypothetical protein